MRDNVASVYVKHLENPLHDDSLVLFKKMAPLDHVRAAIMALKTCFTDSQKLKLLASSMYSASLRLMEEEIIYLEPFKTPGSEQLGKELMQLFNLEKFYSEKWKLLSVLFRLGIVNPIRQVLLEQG